MPGKTTAALQAMARARMTNLACKQNLQAVGPLPIYPFEQGRGGMTHRLKSLTGIGFHGGRNRTRNP